MLFINIEHYPSLCLLHSLSHSLSSAFIHSLSFTVSLFLRLLPVSLAQVVPLANLIVKEALSEEDVLTCQKTVYNLVDMERKNDPLPISTVGSRGKGPKR